MYENLDWNRQNYCINVQMCTIKKRVDRRQSVIQKKKTRYFRCYNYVLDANLEA